MAESIFRRLAALFREAPPTPPADSAPSSPMAPSSSGARAVVPAISNAADPLERYLKYLSGAHTHLKLKGLSHGHVATIRLLDVYISLRAVAGEGQKEERTLAVQPFAAEDTELTSSEAVSTRFLDTSYYDAADRLLKKVSAEHLLATQPRLSIIGEPGSGKTTLALHLTLRLCQQRLDSGQGAIPVFLRLSSLGQRALPRLDELGALCLPEVLRGEISDDFLQQHIQAGACALCFDGLDEVTDPERRRQVAHWIDDLAAAYPGNRFIVTSRILGYRQAPLHNGFHAYRLCDFDAEDVRGFINHWQAAVEPPFDNETAEDRRTRLERRTARLLEILREKPGIRALAANPLLLTIVLLVYNSRTRLPEERGRLYDECIDVLLEHLQKARLDESERGGFHPTQGLKLEQQRDLLKRIALWLHRRGTREAQVEALCRELLEIELPAIGMEGTQAVDFLREVTERSGLLIERGGGLGFSHLAFQEYLTALALVDNAAMDSAGVRHELLAHAHHSWWREVIQLYAGAVADATELIRPLLHTSPSRYEEPAILAGACLADARRVADVKLRQEVIARLSALYQDSPFGYVRLLARQTLVRIGTPEVAKIFIALLHKPHEDLVRARNAVEILSRLQTGANVRAALVQVLSSSEVPQELMRSALRGLCNIQKSDVALQEFLLAFLDESQPQALRIEALITLGALSPSAATIETVRTRFLRAGQGASAPPLDGCFVAAAKGFLHHLPGREALALVEEKLAQPEGAEYKIELCRALVSARLPDRLLMTTFLRFVEAGPDWGARGGAALALGLLRSDRTAIAEQLAARLAPELDIGVRLRLADALGHLGCFSDRIRVSLSRALAQPQHALVRTKLVEAYAMLSSDLDFIFEQLHAPLLRATPVAGSDGERQQLECLRILWNLESYLDDLTRVLIVRLPDASPSLKKESLRYLSRAPEIAADERQQLHTIIEQIIDDRGADPILRSLALEAWFALGDLLSPAPENDMQSTSRPSRSQTKNSDPTRTTLRQILRHMCPDDATFSALCSDVFKEVYQRFTTGMDRLQRETLLLDVVSAAEIVSRLEKDVPAELAPHRHLLESSGAPR